MAVFDWLPFLNKWKPIAQPNPYISTPTYHRIKIPRFEIRTHVGEDLVDTWFFIDTGEGEQRRRISATSTPHLVNRWRSFLQKCENYNVGPMPSNWWAGSYRIVLNEEVYWVDDKGRQLEPLQLIQELNNPIDNGLKIRFGDTRMSFETFRIWLDMLDEHHKHYTETVNT